MKTILCIMSILLIQAHAKSNTEKIGDALAFLIPATAYGSTFYMDDEEGRMQFYKAYGTTMLSTVALEYTVREKRPTITTETLSPLGIQPRR